MAAGTPRISPCTEGTAASSGYQIRAQDWSQVRGVRGTGKKLERCITGRARNGTLGKGDRRDVGNVSLNPLPVPPVDPRISSWRQTAATDATLGWQHAHTRAHTPRRELHAADFCLTSQPKTPYLPGQTTDSCGPEETPPLSAPCHTHIRTPDSTPRRPGTTYGKPRQFPCNPAA